MANDNVQSFVRHDTPHPKELKARHQKLFNKENASPSNPTVDVSNEPANNSALNSAMNSGMNPGINSAMQLSAADKSESESSEASSVVVRAGYENAGSNLIANKTSTVQNLNEIDDMLDSYLNMQSNHLHAYELDADQYPNDQYQTEAAQDDYTMDGKHVIFPGNEYAENDEHSDGEEQARYSGEPAHNKLHRRDTPHHLKNKRINSMTNKADADKVASILDKLNNQMNYDASEESKTSSSTSSVNNNLSNNLFNNFNNANPDSYPSAYPMEPCEVKQLRFHLTRSNGLGLSIAGGKGKPLIKSFNWIRV